MPMKLFKNMSPDERHVEVRALADSILPDIVSKDGKVWFRMFWHGATFAKGPHHVSADMFARVIAYCRLRDADVAIEQTSPVEKVW